MLELTGCVGEVDVAVRGGECLHFARMCRKVLASAVCVAHVNGGSRAVAYLHSLTMWGPSVLSRLTYVPLLLLSEFVLTRSHTSLLTSIHPIPQRLTTMSVQRERSGPEMATGPVPSVDELTTMFAALTVRPKRSGKTTAVVVASPRPARKLLDLPAELLNSMLLLVSPKMVSRLTKATLTGTIDLSPCRQSRSHQDVQDYAQACPTHALPRNCARCYHAECEAARHISRLQSWSGTSA